MAVIAGLVGVGVAGWEFKQAGNDREIASLEREQEGIARAWSILTTPATGNTGKVQALEYLAPRVFDLEGIDLSCGAMGGIERRDPSQIDEGEAEVGCPKPTYLHGLSLASGPTLEAQISLRNADFEDADLGNAVFHDVNLYNTNLAFTNLLAVDFAGSELNYTVFHGSYYVEHAKFERTWSWSDTPPYGLDPKYGPHFFCEFEGDNFDADAGFDDRGRRLRGDDTECSLNPKYGTN